MWAYLFGGWEELGVSNVGFYDVLLQNTQNVARVNHLEANISYIIPMLHR